MKIKEICDCIEEFAPLAYQESYDNAGLQCGDPQADVKAALLCIDVTPGILEEAVRLGAGLVISHHPVIFGGLKRLTGATLPERLIMDALKNDIAIYSAHTNVDSVYRGVSFRMAEKIGLSDVKVLAPVRGKLKKLVFFVPEDDAAGVREAIFEAGAGHIGEYDMCSFNAAGKGSFRGSDETDPYVGKKGEFHMEPELRVETIFPADREKKILSALISAHPYDEVAYDVYPLDNEFERLGMGVVGKLDTGLDEKKFMELLKKEFGVPVVRHSPLTGSEIRKVAMCGGSGSFLLGRAISSGADAFVTGDVKYHPFFDASGKILMADIGHYESEQFTTDIFYDLLMKNFPNFAVHLTELNTNPVNYY